MHVPVPQIPDYVRCGPAIYYVTWLRLVTVCLAVLLVVVGLSEIQEHLPVESDLASDKVSYSADAAAASAGGAGSGLRGLLGKAASRLTAGHGAEKKKASNRNRLKGLDSVDNGKQVARPSVMPSWCKPSGSLYYLDKWHLAHFGAEGYAEGNTKYTGGKDSAGDSSKDNVDSTGAMLCDWLEYGENKAEFPFRLCTFDRAVDTQISTYIHKDGVWNGGKKDLLELLLPRVNEMMDMPERTMVIDVGANVGYYTLLAASRGYDTVAVEPAKQAVLRLLHSLKANCVKIATSGGDHGMETGHTRQPISFVFQNAASDAYNAASLRFISDNPGASWVEAEGRGEAITTVPLDDLLEPGSRDPAASSAKKRSSPQSGDLPVINPSKVRLVKVSAEGYDARALHGMRRLLSFGRVPYVHFVFNSDHVAHRGCDPKALILSLFESGYRLYHGSVFIYREKELNAFLKGMAGLLPDTAEGGEKQQARSTELLFVREGAPFII